MSNFQYRSWVAKLDQPARPTCIWPANLTRMKYKSATGQVFLTHKNKVMLGWTRMTQITSLRFMFISKMYILEIYHIGISTFYSHHPTYFPLQILSLHDFSGGIHLFVRANWFEPPSWRVMWDKTGQVGLTCIESSWPASVLG